MKAVGSEILISYLRTAGMRAEVVNQWIWDGLAESPKLVRMLTKGA